MLLKSVLNFFVTKAQNLTRYLKYRSEFDEFKSLSNKRTDIDVLWENRQPCLSDKTSTTEFDRHYIYHTAWAARVVKALAPQKHVDISSSLHFGTILSAFIPVEFYDYRPALLDIDNINSYNGDLMDLPFENDSVESLSCMHVIEHIGLGRYGDPLDPNADIRAIAELKRVVSKGGHIIFATPVGVPRVMFNAHRVYSYDQIMHYFEELELIEFSLIPDSEIKGGLIRNAKPELVISQNYACGCFLFRKPLK